MIYDQYYCILSIIIFMIDLLILNVFIIIYDLWSISLYSNYYYLMIDL